MRATSISPQSLKIRAHPTLRKGSQYNELGAHVNLLHNAIAPA
jgi:hypothetical protein